MATELARRALEPTQPFPAGAATVASLLYHHSIIWALQSLTLARPVNRSEHGGTLEVLSRPGAGGTSALASPRGVEDLWRAAAPEPALLRLNLTSDEIARAKLCMARFAAHSDLQLARPERDVATLRPVAEALLYTSDVSLQRYTAPALARGAKVALVLLALAWVGVSIHRYLDDRRNLALGMPWRASTTTQLGCKSPAQECIESPGFFFHTQEENQPWLEIDLGVVRTISSVKVTNRADCCADRVIPLVLEVSTDQQSWRQVASQTALFSAWHPEFSPLDARWVRLRVAKRSSLHLISVGVYE